MDNVLDFETARKKTRTAEKGSKSCPRPKRPAHAKRKARKNKEIIKKLDTQEKLKIIAKALTLWEDGVDVKDFMYEEARKQLKAKENKKS